MFDYCRQYFHHGCIQNWPIDGQLCEHAFVFNPFYAATFIRGVIARVNIEDVTLSRVEIPLNSELLSNFKVKIRIMTTWRITVQGSFFTLLHSFLQLVPLCSNLSLRRPFTCWNYFVNRKWGGGRTQVPRVWISALSKCCSDTGHHSNK